MIINSKKKLFFIYTVAFALLMGMIVFFYYSSGNSLIDYYGDGFRQYFRALVYYSNYLKTIVGNLFDNHNLVIPQWDYSIGEGNDVLITFHYYGMGDVINLFSVFVPEKQMYLFYDASIALRVFFSGIFFAWLCIFLGKKNYDAIFVGSILYTFSGFSLVSISGHIAFLNAIFYLPLVILGVEKIIKDNTVSSLMLSVSLCSLASFYFFYMIALMTMIYVCVRLSLIRKKWKDRFLILLKIALGSIVGVLISASIFIPYLNAALGSTRVTNSIKTSLLFPFSYYVELMYSIVFCYGGLFGNYSVLLIPSVAFLFIKNNKTELRILVLCTLVFLCFPIFGLIFNGFVYSTNRWFFGISLLANYVIVDMYDCLLDEKKGLWAIFGFLVAYMFLCAIIDAKQWQIYTMYGVTSVVLYLFMRFSPIRSVKSLICIGIALFSVFFSIIYRFSPLYWNYAESGTPIATASAVEYEQSSSVSKLEETFYRYSADSFVTNSSIQAGQSTTQYYWSLANDDVIDFRNNLGLSDHNNHHYDNYDGRLSLNSLACVKYMIVSGNNQPTGFRYAFRKNGYSIFRSDYSLPLLYLYENYIEKESWLQLDILSRQQTLLNAAVIEGEFPELTKINKEKESEDIEYTDVFDPGISMDDSSLNVSSAGSSIKYTFNCEEGYEYYLVIEGLDSDISAILAVSDLYENVKPLFFKCRTHNAYPNRHNFAMCLGTSEKGRRTVDLTFYSSGKYEYSSIKIQRLSVEKQINDIADLRSAGITELTVETNKLNANINSHSNSILCIAVPYSKGWKAYIDGKETEIIKTNVMYMGVPVEEGEHIVNLEYSTPYLKTGTAVSIIGIAVWIMTKKKEKKYRQVNK